MDKHVNSIINHIKSIKNGTSSKSGICVLIGAGADLSSGGFLFRELKLRFLHENGCIIPTNIADEILDQKFEEIIDQISQENRCETLDVIMRKHKSPSEGYELLVMLAMTGYIDAVITTNFDYLLEETQSLLNLTPFTIFTPGKTIPEEYYMRRTKNTPVYIKMHGDLSDRLVTHLTKNEIEKKQYGDNFANLVRHTITNNGLIVVGYGGYDSLITEIFENEIENIDEVYWCNIRRPEHVSGLADLLQRHNKLSFVNTTFDNLFQELSRFLLKDVLLENTNPIFLPTVIQSKIDSQILMFENEISYKNKLVKRKKEYENLENFLTTINDKSLAIVGEYKYGKSSFIYESFKNLNDITYIPILCNQQDSILGSMALAIGYKTDVPFPIVYSFLKWWEKGKRQLVFILDGFFNSDYITNKNRNYVIEFLNFLYIAREFEYIQFVISFQNDVYRNMKIDNTFASFGNIISEKIYVGEFSDEEVRILLEQNGADQETIYTLKNQRLLHIPYVWEILNKNNIILTKETDCFAQYIDAIYKISTNSFKFTKHAFNVTIEKIAYNQIFDEGKPINMTSQEYIFLRQKEIIDSNNNIIYLELAVYLCKQYILRSDSWENVVENITKDVLKRKNSLSDTQIDVYVSVLGEMLDIERYSTLFNALEKIIDDSNLTICIKEIIIKTLQQCIRANRQLFEIYLKSIDINTYSQNFQHYLFKVCADFFPEVLVLLGESSLDSKLKYAYFLLDNDNLYNLIRDTINKNIEITYINYFKGKDNVVKLCHLLTYWGWDNTTDCEYEKLKKYIVEQAYPDITLNKINLDYSAMLLKEYAYNIFFNAGQDFEEQYIQCRNTLIYDMINVVINKNALSTDQYYKLMSINTDINNSWIFVLSNIIVVQAMKNQPEKTYNMLFHFWDNIDFDVQPQHLDFYLSCMFWSLYVCAPNDQTKFSIIFEKIIEKYERILFVFPTTKRRSSLLKFSQEFDVTFEDGFNPIAFYFYTAPYKSITKQTDWDYGRNDLKIYWDLAKYMSSLGKYDDILRIVHALGQMISIFPKEGYSALQNIAEFDHPIIKKGLIRIFKENYLRYSEITKKEMTKEIYHFNADDINEIIYNSDFLLENRTMEQLHWGRLFYNMEQLFHVDMSNSFLSNFLQSKSCVEFLRNFIKMITAGDT